MASNLAFLLASLNLITIARSGSVPFYKDVMKDFTKQELETVNEFMTIDQQTEQLDVTSTFECDVYACNQCVDLKIGGQKRQICIRHFNRKSKPSGLTALYIDGKQAHDFVVFNRYCQHFWGKISGCFSVYDRTPELGRSCHKVDLNLLFTLVTLDFNCVVHKSEQIELGTTAASHKGQGIVVVDLYSSGKPSVKIQQKDGETVKFVKTAVKELLEKM